MISIADYLTAAQLDDVVNFRGALDVTGALNGAFSQQRQRVQLVAGRYRVDGPLAPPVCAGIRGDGQENTILDAGPATTTLLPLYGWGCSDVADLCIDGKRTHSGAKGILVGDAKTAERWHGRMSNVRIEHFRGDRAIGLHVADTIKALFSYVRVGACTTNLVCRNLGGHGYPTTTSFHRCEFVNATENGATVNTGESLVFDGCLFEGNGERGLLVDSWGGTTANNIYVVGGSWFEDNWRSATSFADKYQFVCLGPAGTARPILRDCYFHATSRPRSIKLSGSSTHAYRLEGVTVPNRRGEVLVERGAWGVMSWPPTVDPSLVVERRA